MQKSEVFISYKGYEPSLPPVILLHGLANAKETWEGCAKIIANRTGSKVYALDTRNHGDSGWSYKIGYEEMADDLKHFMDSMYIQKAVIVGHSLGGKTALNFALKYPERLRYLILEDISLNQPEINEIAAFEYMAEMKDLLQELSPEMELLEAKRCAADILSGRTIKNQPIDRSARPKIWDGSDLPLRQKEGGGFEWKTNVDVLENCLGTTKWSPVRSQGIYKGPTLIIYGTKSPFKVLEDKEKLLKQFPCAVYEPIQRGSHALHVEFPEIFCGKVCDFILKQRLLTN